MQPKEHFEVNIRSIGLLALIAGLVGLVGWATSDDGQYIMEICALLAFGGALVSAPSAVSVWAYREKASDEKNM